MKREREARRWLAEHQHELPPEELETLGGKGGVSGDSHTELTSPFVRLAQHAELFGTSGLGAQEAKALDLYRLGDERKAKWVLQCGLRGWECGYPKDCPRCGARYAAEDLAPRIGADIRRMRAPVVVLFRFPSRSAFDLGRSIKDFRNALRTWRRRNVCRLHVRSGSGAIETDVARSGVRFALHAHVVLDVEASFDRVAAAEAFHEITSGRGALLFDPREGVLTIDGLASYVSKPESWCPEAGMDLRLLRQLRRGLYRRRIPVFWGAKESDNEQSKRKRSDCTERHARPATTRAKAAGWQRCHHPGDGNRRTPH